MLRDRESGRYLGVDRHYTMLEIVVSDLDFTDPDRDDVPDAVVTAYHLGSVWRPMPPPLMRIHSPLNNNRPGRTWQKAGEPLNFNEHWRDEHLHHRLADLHAHLTRALHA